MKKILALSMISALALSSCGANETINNPEGTDTKKPYEIEVTNIENFSKNIEISKTGRIKGSQDISVSSQVIGKVNTINKKEGDSVKRGEVLIELSDTIGNYSTKVQRSKNNLEKANINYQSTLLTLNKSIKDSEINLQNAEVQLQTIKETTKQDILTAKNNLSSTSLSDESSSASLDIEKTKQDLEKSKLDYKIMLSKNNDTIASYKNSLRTQYSGLVTSFNDIIEDLDLLFSITEKNKNSNFGFKSFLGETDRALLLTTTDEVRKLIGDKDSILNIDMEGGSDESMINSLNKIQKTYENLVKILEQVNLVLQDSNKTNPDIASYSGKINGYQNAIQAQYSSLISFKNSVTTFVSTYKQNEESSAKHIEILEKSLEIKATNSLKTESDTQSSYSKIVANANQQVSNAENNVKNAKINLQNAKDNRNVTIRSLQNSVDDAKISLVEIQKDYNNLLIKSPIDGRISNITVDEGQEVSKGTVVFSVVNEVNQEINISLSKDELAFVSENKKVEIESNGSKLNGKIKSVGTVADSNLNYKVTITLDEAVSIIGGQVKVNINSDSKGTLIPLKLINTLNDSKGFVYSLKENNIVEKLNVNLGKVWNDKIEITSEIKEGTKIIITEMKNYDENKYELKIK